MFCVIPMPDKDVIKKLCAECEGEFDPSCELNMALIVDETPCGVSQMKISKNKITLCFAGVTPPFRGKGYGDLVMRAAMNKVMDTVQTLEIAWVHPYFKKFGFVEQDGVMVAETEKIVFPSYCDHCKK